MAGPSSSVRLLVVDPDDRLRGLLAQLFTDGGYDVVDVGDLPAALDRCRQGVPDVVVADWDATGDEGLRQLASHAPTVMLSTDARSRHAVAAFAAGFALKGDDLSELMQLVQRASSRP